MPSPRDPADADPEEKDRVIRGIYEVVLRPEHFHDFMQDWAQFIGARSEGLEWDPGSAAAQDVVFDRDLADHFHRAMALFERVGRGDSAARDDGPPPWLRLGRGGVLSDLSPEGAAVMGPRPTLADLESRLDADGVQRLRTYLASFERAPVEGRFAVVSMAFPDDRPIPGAPGGGLLALVTVRAPFAEGYAIEVRPLIMGWKPQLQGALTGSFGLTPRECDLVRALALGGDIAGIADETGRSQNTLRAQLKAVFAKTRTTSQSELMRLVAVLSVLEGRNDVPPIDATGLRESRIELDEGRYLALHCVGPDDGLPVVMLHGMLDGIGILPFVARHAQDSGIRLIAPVRPNFGQSQPDARLRDLPERFARDLGQALRQMGITRAVLVGHMGGSRPAFLCAHRLGPMVAGVAMVAGMVPFSSFQHIRAMAPRQKAIALTAKFAPALLPTVLRAGMAQIDSAGVGQILRSLYAEGTRDEQVARDPAIARALIDGYHFTVAQGLQGFLGDSIFATRDWRPNVLGSTCPVLVIHGGQDAVIALRFVRAFCDDASRFQLVEEPSEGQLVWYAKPAAVTQRIAEFARKCLA
ncbi:MAG: alpha/beta hydrolase [Paracoccaceae bacterium]